MLSNIIAICLALIVSTGSQANYGTCNRVLGAQSQVLEERLQETSEETLVGYLESLILSGHVKKNDLVRVLPFWERGELVSPLEESAIAVDFHKLIAQQTFDSMAGHVNDKRVLTDWLMQKVKSFGEGSVNRKNVKEATRNTYRGASFVSIPAKGNFQSIQFNKITQIIDHRVTDSFDTEELEFDYDFEVMDVPVTVGLWAEIMGASDANKSVIETMKKLKENQFYNVIPNDLEIDLEDYPVAGVTPVLAMLFANRYSISKGLEPAYNIPNDPSELNAWLLTFEGKSEEILKLLKNPNPTAATGFRIPTTMELAFLYEQSKERWERAFNTRSPKPRSEFGMNMAVYKSSGKDLSLEPVASYDPFIVFGESIYDLMGNGREISIELRYSDPKKNKLRQFKNFFTGKKDEGLEISGYGINVSGDMVWRLDITTSNDYWGEVHSYYERKNSNKLLDRSFKYRESLRLVRTLPDSEAGDD